MSESKHTLELIYAKIQVELVPAADLADSASEALQALLTRDPSGFELAELLRFWQMYRLEHRPSQNMALELLHWAFGSKHFELMRALVAFAKAGDFLSQKELERAYWLHWLEYQLEQNAWEKADQVFLKHQPIAQAEYQALQAAALQRWFQEQYHLHLTWEQAEAVADQTPRLLISARAGSGKTTVLACKVAHLVCHYHIKPEEIMILAFNKKAAADILNQIQQRLGMTHFQNARTFHSLAFQIAQPEATLLEHLKDKKHKDIGYALFIYSVYEYLYRAPELFYLFVKFVLDKKPHENQDHLYVSFGGEVVKSEAELKIANFLYLNQVPFVYEPEFRLGKDKYHPDFLIPLQGAHKGLVIEHWGLDLTNAETRGRSARALNAPDYYAQLLKKRAYWQKNRDYIFRETHQGQFREKTFIQTLKKILTEQGLELRPLPRGQRVPKIMVQPIENLIEEALAYFSEALAERPAALRSASTSKNPHWMSDLADTQLSRIDALYHLTISVSQALPRLLEEQRLTTYAQVMAQAVAKIQTDFSHCALRLGSKAISLNSLRYVLVDEYQDFSKEFFNVLHALLRAKPSIQLTCVGDEWQAINSYMGAQTTRYFRGFLKLWPQGKMLELSLNQRSPHSHILLSNRFMQSAGGSAAQARADAALGKVELIELPVCSDSEALLQTLIETIGLILSQHPQDSSVLLTRKQTLFELHPSAFLQLLLSHAQTHALTFRRPEISTIHSYKGKEADTVILLPVVNSLFPLDHFLTDLNRRLYPDREDPRQEERRLFYVALTRARKHLYLLTQKDQASEYLRELGLVSQT